ncbi:MAG: phage shock envelope stress response protein PspM [Mycobacteriales bacterium]
MAGQPRTSVRLAASAARRALDGAQSVKTAVSSYREPRAKLVRARKRARLTVTVRAVVTVMLAIVTWHLFSAGDTVAGGAFAVIAAASFYVTTGSAVRWIKLERTPLPTPPPPLPPATSIARPSIDRLAHREIALARLLPSLGEGAGDTGVKADRAAGALRTYAARLAAVESARAATNAEEPELDEAIETLSGRLDAGVVAYERLVRAAAEAAAAAGAGSPDPMAMRALEDATDRVSGLAKGLREVGKIRGQ